MADNLVEALATHINKKELSDVVFLLDNTRQPFYGHRFVYAAQSTVFKAMLFGNFMENTTNVTLSDVPFSIFSELSNYIYTGSININPDNCIPLFVLSNKYDLPNLHQMCCSYLDREINSVENALAVLPSAIIHSKNDLVKKALVTITKNFQETLISKNFESLSQDALVLILDSDIWAEEIDIFKGCIKWARNQNIAMPDDIKKRIRFPLMEPHQLADEVQPTGVLTQEELVTLLLWNVSKNKSIHTVGSFNTLQRVHPVSHSYSIILPYYKSTGSMLTIDSTKIPLLTDCMTVGMWLNIISSQANTWDLICTRSTQDYSGKTFCFAFYPNNPVNQFYYYISSFEKGVPKSDYTFPYDKWFHMAMTICGDELKIFFDGKCTETTKVNTPIFNNGEPLFIAPTFSGYPGFKGEVKNLIISPVVCDVDAVMKATL